MGPCYWSRRPCSTETGPVWRRSHYSGDNASILCSCQSMSCEPLVYFWYRPHHCTLHHCFTILTIRWSFECMCVNITGVWKILLIQLHLSVDFWDQQRTYSHRRPASTGSVSFIYFPIFINFYLFCIYLLIFYLCLNCYLFIFLFFCFCSTPLTFTPSTRRRSFGCWVGGSIALGLHHWAPIGG